MKTLIYTKKLIAVLFVLFLSTSASAKIITENLVGEVFHGAFSGELGAGSFSYDAALLTGLGEETLNSDKISIEFTVFGQSFTKVDDVDFPSFPLLDFYDGTPVSLEFAVLFGIDEPDVAGFEIYDLLPVAGGGFQTEIVVEPVPLPITVGLFSSGLLGLMGYRIKASNGEIFKEMAAGQGS